jgi:DNA repair protein RadC
MEYWNPEIIEFVEEFRILLMNRSNSVLGILDISKGGISGTVTDVRVAPCLSVAPPGIERLHSNSFHC